MQIEEPGLNPDQSKGRKTAKPQRAVLGPLGCSSISVFKQMPRTLPHSGPRPIRGSREGDPIRQAFQNATFL